MIRRQLSPPDAARVKAGRVVRLVEAQRRPMTKKYWRVHRLAARGGEPWREMLRHVFELAFKFHLHRAICVAQAQAREGVGDDA